jgi:NAD-dependent DNA ligase
MELTNLQKLRAKIIAANKAYRFGHPIISDYEFDNLMDDLAEQDPHDDLIFQVGFVNEKDSRKEKLPIEMASMNKVKTVEELNKWMELKGIPVNTKLILTPKYDGASFCVVEEKQMAYTRGNGYIGQRSDAHLKVLNGGKLPVSFYKGLITVGEVILPTNKWSNWSEDYANPRNMAAGQLNSDEPGQELEDCVYIRYGTNLEHLDKISQLEHCNSMNFIKVPYLATTIQIITEDSLKQLFENWRKDFDIDGIIVEVNDPELRKSLGRERSGNPAYARAYKGNFEEVKNTTVLKVEWNVSKQGYLKPLAHVELVNLDGANVQRVTLFNAKFVQDMGIGVGAVLKIKRSGQVIPFVISVISHGPSTNYDMPFTCPSCGSDVKGNENGVELVCFNDDCGARRVNKIISFFAILGVENAGEGVFTALYNAGYNTVERILSMKKTHFMGLEGFGERKADIVFKAIQEKMKDVSLSKLQHASGIFKILGSKKLVLLEDFYEKNPTVEDILKVGGFAEKSAADYLQGMPKFKAFIENLPITIKKEVKVDLRTNKYEGMVVVFTGFRSKEAEQIIVENGGKIGSSVSKATTHLVIKEKGSGSAKEQKAIDLGIKIWNAEEFKDFLSK